MRKRLRRFAAIAPLLLVLAMPLTGPAPAEAQSSHGNVVASVDGSANWYTPDGFYRRFTFTARKYADSFVDGEWQFVASSAVVHGTVTCLTLVNSHEARIGGHVDQALFTLFQAGTDIGWVATDLGAGQSGDSDQTTNLRAFRNAPPGSAEAFCASGTLPFGGDLSLDSIDHGNTTIYVR